MNSTAQHVPYSTCNWSLNSTQCTPQTCCLAQGSVDYLPTLAGNGIYLGLFAFLLVAHFGLGAVYRTWGFMIGTTLCSLTEVIGYGGRIWMNKAIFAQNPFLIYIVCLTIAPAFLTASIYLSLSRLIALHGPQQARFKPKTYTYIFISFDVLALVLQAVGGAIASTGISTSQTQTGINIMIAGLSWQVVSLIIFMLICTDFAWRIHKKEDHLVQGRLYKNVRALWRFEAALALATLLILVRSCYRVAELQSGFSSSLANNQVIFMILEGPLIIISLTVLAICHPGLVFGRSWGGLCASPTQHGGFEDSGLGLNKPQ